MTTAGKAKAAPACKPKRSSRRKHKKHHPQLAKHRLPEHPATGSQRSKAPDKHRKRRRHKKPRRCTPAKHTFRLAAGLPGAPAPPAIPANPPPPSNAPPPSLGAPLTPAQAHRLLWRAGFGPAPGQTGAFAGQPVEQVVQSLTRPAGGPVLSGPGPTDDEGNALAPADAWGHDHCWWLDRMVRSDQQLVERMTFIWHDWFATSNEKVNDQQRMLDQNELVREHALGSFSDLFLAVTADPAMLVFLDGIYNDKRDPNENYAREMMELFSLGANRGAYSEDDVKELARALTGWRADWTEASGLQNFRFDPNRHDQREKTVFGQTGDWSWEDAVRLCVAHPLHASFFVAKLWSYFLPSAPDEATLASLQGLYLASGHSIRAVVEAILCHPDFLDGPEMVSPPVVYNAGLLRAIGRPIDTTAWSWLSAAAGQQLFYPPNVSGWDFTRWLDTSTVKARWEIANYVTARSYVDPWPAQGEPRYSESEDGPTAFAGALAYWSSPPLSAESSQSISGFAQGALEGRIEAKWQNSPYRAMRQNALRLLIATSPDMQVS